MATTPFRLYRNYFYFESVALYFNDQKRTELLEYIIGITLVGTYFLGIMILEPIMSLKAKRYSKAVLSGMFNQKNKKLIKGNMAKSIIDMYKRILEMIQQATLQVI